MKQYVWHRAGSLGDVVCLMNLVKNFRAKHGDIKLILRTHPWTKNIMEEFVLTCGVDEVVDHDKVMSNEIQLWGYAVNHKEPLKGHPYVVSNEHLITGFAKNLGVEPDFDSLDFKKPPFPFKGDYLTIHVKSGWSNYKEWSFEKWEELCERFKKEGIKVLQIGGREDPVIKNCHGVVRSSPGESEDKMLFKMGISALANARLHIGIDSWSTHALNIKWDGSRTKSIILWGSSNVNMTGYKTQTNIVKGLPCQPCLKESPYKSKVPLGPCHFPPDQTYDKPRHHCMGLINIDEVFNKAMSMW